MTKLKTLLADPARGLVAPGVYDAFTALLAEQAGFDALYLSGASIAYTRLGRPDIGLVSVSEVISTIELITDRVGFPTAFPECQAQSSQSSPRLRRRPDRSSR